MRAAALKIDNRGHTNFPIDQMTYQQMSHTLLNNKGDLPQEAADETVPNTQPSK